MSGRQGREEVKVSIVKRPDGKGKQSKEKNCFSYRCNLPTHLEGANKPTKGRSR